jgi:hypothetical protein
MSFTPNIPASGQSLGNSRTQVLNNFSSLRNTIAVNHTDVNDSGAGKHKFVQMPEQSSGPATAVNEGALYTKAVAGFGGTLTRLFWRPENTASGGTEYQLTNINPYFSTPNGYTPISNGLVLIFGTASLVASGNTTITFPNGLTLLADPYWVSITSKTSSVNVTVPTVSTTGFTANKTSSIPTSIYWMAIGSV